jgi:hypothetical protein
MTTIYESTLSNDMLFTFKVGSLTWVSILGGNHLRRWPPYFDYPDHGCTSHIARHVRIRRDKRDLYIEISRDFMVCKPKYRRYYSVCEISTTAPGKGSEWSLQLEPLHPAECWGVVQ